MLKILNRKLITVFQKDICSFFFNQKRVLRKLKDKSFTNQINNCTGIHYSNISKEGIHFYKNVLSIPVHKNISNTYSGGLYDGSNGKPIKCAVHKRNAQDLTSPSEFSNNGIKNYKIHTIDRSLYYGGILFNHFGHFMLESLIRLWAYKVIGDHNLYIAYHTLKGEPDFLNNKNFINKTLNGFSIPVKKIFLLNQPIILKNLIIPDQLYGYGFCKNPDERFINFLRSFRFNLKLPPDFIKADNIYVSRSFMPPQSGKPIAEKEFERYLVENGYKIFHPEKYDLIQQLSVYASAKKIIFCDGGSIHCCILLPDIKAEISVIARRRDHRWNCISILDQFTGFDKKVIWIDCVKSQYQFGLETWYAAGEIDWYQVSIQLYNNHFVAKLYEEYLKLDFNHIKKKELQEFIYSIQHKKEFLKYMMNLKEDTSTFHTST